MSSENPTPSPSADPNLLNEHAIFREFLDTIDSDDDVSSDIVFVQTVSIQPKKERTLNVVRAVI